MDLERLTTDQKVAGSSPVRGSRKEIKVQKIICPKCIQEKRNHKANILVWYNRSSNHLTNGLVLESDQFWHDKQTDTFKCMYDGYIVSGYEVSKLMQKVEED